MHADIDSYLSEGCLHLRFWHWVGSIHVYYLVGLSDWDICLSYSLEQGVYGFFFFIFCWDSTSSHFSYKFLISNDLTTIQIKLIKEKLKLHIINLKPKSPYCTQHLILRQLSTIILIKFLEICHNGYVILVDVFYQPSKYVYIGGVILVSWF